MNMNDQADSEAVAPKEFKAITPVHASYREYRTQAGLDSKSLTTKGHSS